MYIPNWVYFCDLDSNSNSSNGLSRYVARPHGAGYTQWTKARVITDFPPGCDSYLWT